MYDLVMIVTTQELEVMEKTTRENEYNKNKLFSHQVCNTIIGFELILDWILDRITLNCIANVNTKE